MYGGAIFFNLGISKELQKGLNSLVILSTWLYGIIIIHVSLMGSLPAWQELC
jgi:hypothetical protein